MYASGSAAKEKRDRVRRQTASTALRYAGAAEWLAECATHFAEKFAQWRHARNFPTTRKGRRSVLCDPRGCKSRIRQGFRLRSRRSRRGNASRRIFGPGQSTADSPKKAPRASAGLLPGRVPRASGNETAGGQQSASNNSAPCHYKATRRANSRWFLEHPRASGIAARRNYANIRPVEARRPSARA